MGVCSRTTTICLMQHAQATPAYIFLHVVFGEIVHLGRSVLILALQMHTYIEAVVAQELKHSLLV